MNPLLHQIMGGLASGGVYAGLALAAVIIYQSTHHLNFAQGEMAMFSTFAAWSMIDAGVPFWLAFVSTIVISFVCGMIIERVIVRPVQNGPVLSGILIFIGLLLVFNSLAGWLFGYTVKTFPSPFPKVAPFGNTLISAHELGSIAVIFGLLCVLYVYFRFTPLGLAMRASAFNPRSSRLVGIRVGWMLSLGWGLAAAIGAVAGMLVAPITYLDPNMMSGVLIYGFSAALLGGLDNPWGAVLGGFIIGVLENVLGAFVIGTELKLTVALAVIILVLLYRPNGLFGRTIVTRV